MVDLDPAMEGEANKRPPAVIVSNDGANASAARLGRGIVTVVPMTSNTEQVFPFQVLVPAGASGLPVESKAQAEQVRAVSVTRLSDKMGALPLELLDQVDEALPLHLAL